MEVQADEVSLGAGHLDDDLSRAFSDYLVLELGQSKRTARAYLQGIRRLEAFCAKSIEDITPPEGRLFLRESFHAPSTKNGTVAAWKSLHKYGALEGRWELNGILAIRGPKVRQRRQDSVDFADVPLILDNCRLPVEFRLIYLGLFAGLRRREATFVRRRDWEDGWILVREGKGGIERRVPVHPELELVRRIVLASAPEGVATMQKACARLRERTGLAFKTHQLRTTFSRKLESLEVPNEVRGEIMGHAPNMQSHYSGVGEKRMMEAVNQIDYSEAL